MDLEISEVSDDMQGLIDLNLLAETPEKIVTEKIVKPTAAKSADERLTQLPLARIRNIMKIDPDVPLLSREGVFAITKATEIFIAQLAIESYNYTVKQKKKTLQKKDVDNAIDNVDALVFLEGAMNF